MFSSQSLPQLHRWSSYWLYANFFSLFSRSLTLFSSFTGQNQYYGSHYARLQTIKNTFDPQGLFTFPNGVQGDITPPPPPPPTSVSVAIHPNGNANKCLDVQSAIFANGTPVQMYVWQILLISRCQLMRLSQIRLQWYWSAAVDH